MRALFLLFALIAGLLGSAPASAAWNAEWTKRTKVSLNTTASGVPLTGPVEGVPVLVRLHTGNFGFLDAAPDGADLRVIAADDKTPLKFHVEKFDGLNELALLWVQLPRLEASRQDDHFWIYYGNPKAPPAGDPRGTYDASQALVYHFGGAAPVPQDATANGNHALRSSARPSAVGAIGDALQFDGSSELVVAAAPSLEPSAGGMTVSLWIKPAALDDAVLLRQRLANLELSLEIQGGKLVARAGALQAAAPAPLNAGGWQHVALVATGNGVTVYQDGQPAARAEGTVALPKAEFVFGSGFKGEIDELQVASTARSAEWIKVAAASQGQGQALLSYGAAEGSEDAGEGASYIKILLSAVTLDGWVVIAILMFMMVLSFWVMVSKTMSVSRAAEANERFLALFRGSFEGLAARLKDGGATDPRASRFRESPLFRLYRAGNDELQQRLGAAAAGAALSAASLDAIRASIDARMVRETQRLNSRMVLLTISIAGGPFLGLLGTVVGVMITFAAIAAAGDVNVNAIAPGIAAALVATVAGLAVAIPALFGYNYLTGRIGNLVADMQVFVDELVTRYAEHHTA